MSNTSSPQPPGGPTVNRQQQQSVPQAKSPTQPSLQAQKSATMRPVTVVSPVATPAPSSMKRTSTGGSIGSKTLTATHSSPAASSSISTNSRSPPPRANSNSPGPNAIASSSLASFYGDLSSSSNVNASEEGGGQEGDTSSSQRQLLDTTADDEPDSTASGNTSATSFYASLAANNSSSSSSTQQQPTIALSPASKSTTNKSAAGSRVASPMIETSAYLDLPASPVEDGANTPSPLAAARVPSILSTIQAKFDNPPINLADSSKRILVKEGLLARQATFKNVSRYCYLFSDLFIVTEPVVNASTPAASSSSSPANTRLTMKQIVALNECDVLPGKKPHIFTIVNSAKDLTFETSSPEEAKEWMDALIETIKKYKGEAPAKPSVAVSASSKETVFTAIDKHLDHILLELLSEQSADPNQVDSQGQTPLHHCVRKGYVIGVTLLLSHGADMTRQNPDGKTPLHLAALRDEYAILLVFLSREPKLDEILDMDGRSVLWDLCCGPYRLNEDLRDGDNPTSPNPNKSPRSDSSDDEKSDDDTPNPSSSPSSPLSPEDKDLRTRETIQRNSWKDMCECLNLMIEQGIDLELKDKTGRTLLMHLASIHSHEALELLLSHGASLSMIDDNGNNALHYAVSAELGHCEVNDLSDIILTVQLLVQAGINPNLRDHHGNTPLHVCSSLPVAGCLIVHGARTELKNESGQKASHYFDDMKGADAAETQKALRDARDQWASRPDTFLPPNEDLEAKSWLDDELSDACLLCSEPFSLMRRKHHCRRCGLLVCAYCSSKKFTDTKKKESGRCCDGCFNYCAAKYLIHARAVRKAQAKRRQEEEQIAAEKKAVAAAFDASHKEYMKRSAQEEERIAEKLKRIDDMKAHPEKQKEAIKNKQAAHSAAHPSASSSSSSSNAPANDKTRNATAKSNELNAQMSQNRQLAAERGEKLSQLEMKTQQMEENAANFAQMAQKLKEKQKSSWF